MAEEGFLQLVMNRGAGGESFDGRDFMSLDLASCNQAGTDRFTVKQNTTGATVSGIAADLGSGQAETFPKNFGEAFHGRHRRGHLLSVYRKCNGSLGAGERMCGCDHQQLPTQASSARPTRVR